MGFELDFGLAKKIAEEKKVPTPSSDSDSSGLVKNEDGTITFDGDLSELLERFSAAKEDRPPRKPKPSKTKPGDKTFVAFHYRGTENDSYITKRDPVVQAMIHFFVRPGDTWVKTLNDAKDDKKYHPTWKIIAHDHAWNEPCVPSEKGRCREILSD
jgi:hypothetical protein